MNKKHLIFGLCNPMIDITANVDKQFLNKFNLLPNDAILGDNSNYNIYDEMKEKYPENIEYTSGGSGQNTMRTIAWILKERNATLFMGCVGDDIYAQIVKEKANEIGLDTVFQMTQNAPTATCAVLLTGANRSLVCHLGAAKHFSSDFFDDPQNWSLLENIEIYYITGFFFTVCYDAMIRIAKFSDENDRIFSLNLSAIFITECFKKEFNQIIPFVDILFGNDEEALSFSRNILNIVTTDIKKVVKAISNMNKLNKRKRLVIITRAERSVIFGIGNKVGEVQVPVIEPGKIIDTSCAGDAFVGGFLAQYIKGKNLEQCIKCGIWASGLIIQRSGCTFPDLNYDDTCDDE